MTKFISAAPALAALILALGAATAAAAQTQLPARQCFTSRNVNNFAQQDHRTVNIRVGVRDFYQLTTLQDCRDVGFAQGIALRSQSQFICSGLDVEIVVPESIGPRVCQVQSIRKLTDEEVKALPKRAQP